MRDVSWFHPAFALLFAAVIACRPAPSAAPKYLAVMLAMPKVPEGVFLNEPLTFFFSGDLDRASVTSESVSILGADGRAARGAIAVSADSLTFTPAPVLAQDLSDGGYRPDTEYTVQIRGFPWVDGLRGTNGEPLRETYTFRFHTVSAAPPIETLLFVDTEPDRTRPLAFFPPPGGDSYLIGADDVLYLDSDKPIDPSSVRDADFVLHRQGGGSEPVAVRVRLIENDSESRARPKPRRVQSIALEASWESQQRAAVLELTPVKKLPRDSLWRLSLASNAVGPRDFSGHVLWNPMLTQTIHVGARGREFGKGVLHEDFVSPVLSIPRAVPGADGLARWTHSGRVEVRYPAAAGFGTDGHVVLEGSVASTDVHSISLLVESGRRAVLSPAPGLVVLRAQGSLRIGGTLVREVGETDPLPRIDLRAPDLRHVESLTLTSWLEEMRARNRTVTVLVAAGDIFVDKDAEVRSNAPIVLVAGGYLRVVGEVNGPVLPASSGTETGASVFVLGDGGGKIRTRSDATLLAMDAPLSGNPLREEVHYAVLSSPLPPLGFVASWTSAEAGGSTIDPKTGNRWSVRFVREFSGDPPTIEDLAPVDRPQTLEPVGPIQMLIELWVAPGATFEPPFVDFVRLTWENKLAGSGATR